MNNMVKIALGFRSDLTELIEPNRRRSRLRWGFGDWSSVKDGL